MPVSEIKERAMISVMTPLVSSPSLKLNIEAITAKRDRIPGIPKTAAQMRPTRFRVCTIC